MNAPRQCPDVCTDYSTPYRCQEPADHPGDHYLWVSDAHIVTWTGDIDELRRA